MSAPTAPNVAAPQPTSSVRLCTAGLSRPGSRALWGQITGEIQPASLPKAHLAPRPRGCRPDSTGGSRGRGCFRSPQGERARFLQELRISMNVVIVSERIIWRETEGGSRKSNLVTSFPNHQI